MFSSRIRRNDRSEIHADFPEVDAPTGWLHHALTGLFLAVVAVRVYTVLATDAKDQATDPWDWLDMVILLLAAVATLAGQARRLPLQNILVATGIMIGFGGLAMIVGALTGIPFGKMQFTQQAQARIGGTIPWVLPLVWVVVIFNARSVARLIFRPWRKSRTYGAKVIVLTAILAVIFALGFDPYCSKLHRYWLWIVDKSWTTWCGAPWINFLGWLLVSLLILAFSTPFLLNKKPKKSPPFFQPLVIWTALQLLFAAGAAAGGMKQALYVILIAAVATLSGAMAGARW